MKLTSTKIPHDPRDYQHDDEGSDDMLAHLKNSLLGSSVLIPIQNGKLAFGSWQGIYLCEHRNHSRRRKPNYHRLGRVEKGGVETLAFA